MNFDEACDAKATMTPVYGPDGTAYLIAYADTTRIAKGPGLAYVYPLAATMPVTMALGELSTTKPEPESAADRRLADALDLLVEYRDLNDKLTTALESALQDLRDAKARVREERG